MQHILKKTRKLVLVLIPVIIIASKTSAQFATVNDAAQLPDRRMYYELTTQNHSQSRGAIWYEQRINLMEPFDIVFDAYFDDDELDLDGDGIAFVLHNDTRELTAIGDAGGFIGFMSNSSNEITPSFAIEFDTYYNQSFGDPSGGGDHMTFIPNGSTSPLDQLSPTISLPNLENASPISTPKYHQIRLKWEPSMNRMSVFLDKKFIHSEIVDIVNDIFAGDPWVFIGMTAANGAGGDVPNYHKIGHCQAMLFTGCLQYEIDEVAQEYHAYASDIYFSCDNFVTAGEIITSQGEHQFGITGHFGNTDLPYDNYGRYTYLKGGNKHDGAFLDVETEFERYERDLVARDVVATGYVEMDGHRDIIIAFMEAYDDWKFPLEITCGGEGNDVGNDCDFSKVFGRGFSITGNVGDSGAFFLRFNNIYASSSSNKIYSSPTYFLEGMSLEATDDDSDGEDEDGYVIAMKETYKSSGISNIALLKIDKRGNVEHGFHLPNEFDEIPHDIKQVDMDGDGILDENKYILTGVSKNNGNEQAFLAYIDFSNGTPTGWMKRYRTNDFFPDIAYAVNQTVDGNFAIAGKAVYQSGQIGGLPTVDTDAFLIVTDKNGQPIHSKLYGTDGPDDIAYDLEIDPDFFNTYGYLMVGSTESFGQGISNGYLLKTDEKGKTIGCHEKDFVPTVVEVTPINYLPMIPTITPDAIPYNKDGYLNSVFPEGEFTREFCDSATYHEVCENGTTNPVIDFTVNPVCDFDFSDATIIPAQERVIQRKWSFGDGGTSGNQQVSYSYSTPGPHTVCLNLLIYDEVNESACWSQTCTTLTCPPFEPCDVQEPVEFFQVANPNGDCEFTFTNITSTPFPYTFEGLFWDFGDGNYSSSGSPVTHIYDDGQLDHTVCLTVIFENAFFGGYCQKKSCFETGDCITQEPIELSAYEDPAKQVPQVDIFPNPVGDSKILNIQYSSLLAQKTTIEVTDVVGKQWWSNTYDDPMGVVIHQVPTNTLPSGTMIVRIRGEDFDVVKRVVISN